MRKIIAVTIVCSIIITSTAFLTIFLEKPDIEIYEETDIEVEIDVSIKNLGLAIAYDIPLRLGTPYEGNPYQIVNKIEFSDVPERITSDSQGNKFVHYTIDQLEPQTTKNFTIKLKVTLKSIDYNIQKGNIGFYNDSIKDYLYESEYINIYDPGILKLAKEIASESHDIYDIAWNTYEWIIENIRYQQIPGEWDAATTPKNGEGGSAELGNLYVALLRANNIPARRISGWANNFEKGEELQLTRFSHGWSEFYVPNYGWIPVDPTWGKSHKFENFAKTDNSHIIITKGAGIHYLSRGIYSTPYGETELDTDYTLKINDLKVKNLSSKRTLIGFIMFVFPMLLAIFIIYKKLRQRHT